MLGDVKPSPSGKLLSSKIYMKVVFFQMAAPSIGPPHPPLVVIELVLTKGLALITNTNVQVQGHILSFNVLSVSLTVVFN